MITVQTTRTRNRDGKITKLTNDYSKSEFNAMFSASERKRLNNGVEICTCSKGIFHVTMKIV